MVQASDPDPLVNVVTVKFHADGFAVDVAGTSSTDNHSTDLFVPSVRVDKGGPATAQVGDAVTYTFKVTNTSSPGSPALILDSITDPLIGTLTIPASCNSLAVGASCNFTATRTVLAGDPDPLVNTATVHYHPLGFPNDIVDTDDHRVDIVTPSYGQDPDDDDLIPENPYDNSGGNGPTLGTDTAGNTDQTGTQVPAPATSDPVPVVQDNVVVNPAGGQPDPAPVSLDQLPRTGQGLDRHGGGRRPAGDPRRPHPGQPASPAQPGLNQRPQAGVTFGWPPPRRVRGGVGDPGRRDGTDNL